MTLLLVSAFVICVSMILRIFYQEANTFCQCDGDSGDPCAWCLSVEKEFSEASKPRDHLDQ